MSQISRRNVMGSMIGGIVAAPALVSVATLSGTAAAQSTQTTGTAPAIFDAKLGRYTITAIFDGLIPLQKGFFSGDQAEIDRVLSGSGLQGDVLPTPVNTFLLRSDDQTILIDAGMGSLDLLGPGLGRLTPGLAAVNVSPADIDMVILTHGHLDHLGGLVEGADAMFPNAELVVQAAEFAFWTDEAITAQASDDNRGFFLLAQRVFAAYGDRTRQVEPGAEVAPGITMDLSAGHTPGHAVLEIDGGDRSLLMIADTLHSAEVHTALVDTGFGFDVDPAAAAASRRRIFDRAASDNSLIAGSHIHFPGFGRILRDGAAYRYLPASWI
jgi:glyoxylase-like metal-dependent hydrolase (beta-lactamase superfamily II)